jgi:hypothetical protein
MAPERISARLVRKFTQKNHIAGTLYRACWSMLSLLGFFAIPHN